MRTIITHAGSAHPDEFIAIAIIVAKGGILRIERRDPTPEELNDENIWVVDVGGQHDPDKLNFDHHGVPGTEGRCAFDLVLEHLGMRDVASDASPWLEFKSTLDCYGPNKTAEVFDMPVKSLYATLSPIESQAIHRFSQAETITTGDFLYKLLEMIGTGLLEYWGQFNEQLDRAYRASEIEVDHVVFVDYRQCGKLSPSVMYAHMTKVSAAGSVMQDDRGPDAEQRVVLYRHADHPRVDFNRLNADEMHFIHDNGFIAKTKNGDTSDERIRELLAQAID